MQHEERPQWSEVQPSHRTLDQEARFLVRAAAAAGLVARTVGGVAVMQVLDPETLRAYEQVRERPHDIDLLTRRKTSDDVKQLFTSLGYVADERLIAWHGDARHRYFQLDGEGQPVVEVDVFLGTPPLCHDIDFMPRLDRPGPAMWPTDLLLQKVQIHDWTAKDAIDASFVLAAFAVTDGEDARETISASRVAGLLAADWGFHHTATTNLESMIDVAGSALPAPIAERAAARAAELRTVVEGTPKSRRWKLRAKVGTRAQWYEDVEEVLR